MFLSKRCPYAMINLSYLYIADIQTILSSFSFPGTPYPRVPTQKKPWQEHILHSNLPFYSANNAESNAVLHDTIACSFIFILPYRMSLLLSNAKVR